MAQSITGRGGRMTLVFVLKAPEEGVWQVRRRVVPMKLEWEPVPESAGPGA